MQLVAEILREMPSNLVGWLCVLAGLGVHALALTLNERRSARRRPVATARSVQRRSPQTQWQLLAGIVETGLRQIESISALHAAATGRIEAVEYTLNRLLEDCAGLMSLPAAAMQRPVRLAPIMARVPQALST
jgi:hypothetical protein